MLRGFSFGKRLQEAGSSAFRLKFEGRWMLSSLDIQHIVDGHGFNRGQGHTFIHPIDSSHLLNG